MSSTAGVSMTISLKETAKNATPEGQQKLNTTSDGVMLQSYTAGGGASAASSKLQNLQGAVVTADGSLVVSGSPEGRLHIWDAQSGKASVKGTKKWIKGRAYLVVTSERTLAMIRKSACIKPNAVLLPS